MEQILSDIAIILKKNHLNWKNRLDLFLTYSKLRLIRKFRPANFHSVKILKFYVFSDNFDDLYATFREVFINEEYRVNLEGYEYVIDLGANIGLATLYFKWINPHIKIIGFEMDEETFLYYKKNTEDNKLEEVFINQCAVGSSDSMIETFGSRRATTISRDRMSVLPEKADPQRVKIVQVKKLSAMMPDSHAIHIKMDIEGAEVDVLEELYASASFEKIKSLVFEFHFKDAEKIKSMISFLEKENYLVNLSPTQPNGFHMISCLK